MSMSEYAGTQDSKGTNSIDGFLQPEETPTATFKVRRPRGLMKKEEWSVSIAPDFIRFSSPDNDEQITISKAEANSHIEFTREFTIFQSGNINVKYNGQPYLFVLDKEGKSRLRSWLPKKTAVELKNDLRKWGIGLIALGIIHLVLTGFLDPIWGVLIAGVGVLNILIPKRGMFIVNGIAIIIAGIMNASAGGGWKMFGMLQFVWGIQEIRKFREYV